MYEQYFSIRSMALTAGSWADIVGESYLPLASNIVIVFNNGAVDVYLRSDPGNAASQVTIQPGQQFEIGASGTQISSYIQHRFPLNCSALGSLKSSSGNTSVLIESLQ